MNTPRSLREYEIMKIPIQAIMKGKKERKSKRRGRRRRRQSKILHHLGLKINIFHLTVRILSYFYYFMQQIHDLC